MLDHINWPISTSYLFSSFQFSNEFLLLLPPFQYCVRDVMDGRNAVLSVCWDLNDFIVLLEIRCVNFNIELNRLVRFLWRATCICEPCVWTKRKMFETTPQ